MFATPVLSNGGTRRGLPISCFLNYVDDSREGITDHFTENAFLSSFGGGIGGHWSDVRSAGSKTSKGSESTGVIPFVKVVDAEMLAFSQGVTRRGSYAGYLHISHPEIEEFLDVRKPTGGDTNRKCLNLHHGIVISDSFMERIHNAGKIDNFDDSWDLVDPHTKRVVKTVSARALWVKLLLNRMETGEPYIMFENAVQNELPDFQKRKGNSSVHTDSAPKSVKASQIFDEDMGEAEVDMEVVDKQAGGNKWGKFDMNNLLTNGVDVDHKERLQQTAKVLDEFRQRRGAAHDEGRLLELKTAISSATSIQDVVAVLSSFPEALEEMSRVVQDSCFEELLFISRAEGRLPLSEWPNDKSSNWFSDVCLQAAQVAPNCSVSYTHLRAHET